jgi:hypothetical protein
MLAVDVAMAPDVHLGEPHVLFEKHFGSERLSGVSRSTMLRLWSSHSVAFFCPDM